ncbi:uncharacterized protein LOC129875709 [Solanum dulcamara]|uniref:uncharacterized protein LOC129875709 n=1 Tax=Solanum dulcamara TaxID=45834 RepID=UPI00248540BD|nr:uncharacterized protein LOC129875709 [Solanum dulcamara]
MSSTSRTPDSTAMATAEKAEKFTEEGNPENEKFIVTEAWTHSDFLCKNYILNGLKDNLYNVFSKYKTEDAGLKKFVDGKFLDYKIDDSKTVMSQVQELQVIIHDLLAEGMIINGIFQVTALIEKLSPLWKDFKNYLKHKRKEMTLEDLIVRLRIKEDNKAAEKKARGNSTIMGANIIEDGPHKSKKRKKPFGPKNYPSKKKFKRDCHNCGKTEHKAVECCAPKKEKKKGQANMVDTNGDVENLCAMLTDANW